MGKYKVTLRRPFIVYEECEITDCGIEAENEVEAAKKAALIYAAADCTFSPKTRFFGAHLDTQNIEDSLDLPDLIIVGGVAYDTEGNKMPEHRIDIATKDGVKHQYLTGEEMEGRRKSDDATVQNG